MQDNNRTDSSTYSNEPRTFLKVLSILDAFSITESELTTNQIAKRCNVNNSSIYRYLSALENHGYLTRNPENGKYMIGLKLLELGGIAMAHMDVRYHGQMALDKLSKQLECNSNISVLYEGDIIHIAFSVFVDHGPLHGVIGRRTPAHCTAMGKVLLAASGKENAHKIINQYGWRSMTSNSIHSFQELDKELEQVCMQGFATDNMEAAPKISCIAYPVLARNNTVIAAISVSNYTYRMETQRETANRLLRESAEKLSYALGYFGSYPYISSNGY